MFSCVLQRCVPENAIPLVGVCCLVYGVSGFSVEDEEKRKFWWGWRGVFYFGMKDLF